MGGCVTALTVCWEGSGGGLVVRSAARNTSGSHVRPMPQDTRIALFLLAELVAALQANDPDKFKRWLCGGIQT